MIGRLLLTKSKLISIKDLLTFNNSNSSSFNLCNLFQHFFFERIIYDVFVNKEKPTYCNLPSVFNSLIQIIYTNISVPQFFKNILFTCQNRIISVVIYGFRNCFHSSVG